MEELLVCWNRRIWYRLYFIEHKSTSVWIGAKMFLGHKLFERASKRTVSAVYANESHDFVGNHLGQSQGY